MKEIRLDFLQNPPINKEVASIVLKDYNFDSIAIKESKDEKYRQTLKNRFNSNYVLPFNFSSAGFIEFMLNFKRIYFISSLHYEIRDAISKLKNIIQIHNIRLDDLDLDTIDSNSDKDTLIILPVLNEDIFSINDICNIRNSTLALDISYSYRLTIESPLADVYFINGATFGMPSGYGLIISDKSYTPTLYKKGVTEAFCKVLDNQIKTDDTNMILFDRLKNILGDDIDLFAKKYAPNTLPLRLKHINTRNLIQNLYLDRVIIQSSQECYLGFIKPSHTLTSLGFSQVKARELCAITFDYIDDIELVATKIADSYKLIRLMEF